MGELDGMWIISIKLFKKPSTGSSLVAQWFGLHAFTAVKSESESDSVVSSSLWLCDCIVHGILQVRTLEWVAFPFSRGSSQPRDGTQVSHIAGRFFTSWAIEEAQGCGPSLIPDQGTQILQAAPHNQKKKSTETIFHS